MMEQFHLIIQKTTTGLTAEYSSPGIDPNHPNVIKTLEDERAFATQIVMDSDVYTLEITEHFRIYSLIVMDIDKFGRSGFYQFKLYGPRDNPLENFYTILQEIKNKYNEETTTKPYESILSTILLTPTNNKADYISGKQNNKKYYSFYDEANLDSLKEIFRDKGVFLINKLYALNKAKAYDENVIQSVGLLPFYKGLFREVTIANPHQVLKDLFLNNEKLDVKNVREEIKILVEPKDILTYTTSESKTIKTITGNFLQIQRKPPIYKPVPPQVPKAKRKFFLMENAVYFLALVIMIGAAGFAFPYIKQYLVSTPENANSDIKNNCPEIIMDSEIYMFDKKIDEAGEHYTTSFRGLGHYIFTYSDSGWTFKNTIRLNEYRNLNKEVIKDLKAKDSVPLNIEERNRIIATIEKESGKPLISEIVNKNSSHPTLTKTIEKIKPMPSSESVQKEDKTSDNNAVKVKIDL